MIKITKTTYPMLIIVFFSNTVSLNAAKQSQKLTAFVAVANFRIVDLCFQPKC